MSRSKTLFLASAAALLFAVPGTAGEIVPLGHFDSVGLNGGGHVVLKHGAVQSVTLLKGSTQYTSLKIRHGNDLEIDACNNNCPEHYELEIEIVTPDINAVAINGGGEIQTAGAFPAQGNLDAAVNGGGHIDMHDIDAKSVSAAVNGGGHILVTATASLSAAVQGGGHISYRGNPSVSQAVQGGGSVDRVEN